MILNNIISFYIILYFHVVQIAEQPDHDKYHGLSRVGGLYRLRLSEAKSSIVAFMNRIKPIYGLSSIDRCKKRF